MMTNGLSYSKRSHSLLWPLPLTRRACFLPFTLSILVWSLASLLTKPFPGKAYASEQQVNKQCRCGGSNVQLHLVIKLTEVTVSACGGFGSWSSS